VAVSGTYLRIHSLAFSFMLPINSIQGSAGCTMLANVAFDTFFASKITLDREKSDKYNFTNKIPLYIMYIIVRGIFPTDGHHSEGYFHKGTDLR
jgi:hypothetical protein